MIIMHVAFGSTQRRPFLPNIPPYSRMGISLFGQPGKSNADPGQYNNHLFNSFIHLKDQQPVSKKGYVIGARSAPRFGAEYKMFITPGPIVYQRDINERTTVKPANAPFDSRSERFPFSNAHACPGPGTYEHEVSRNRRINFKDSFGGQHVLQAPVTIKCMVKNEDVCDYCHKPPIGDYYQYRRHVICRQCFAYNIRYGEKRSRSHFHTFRKVRDCSRMHEHQGTKAAIQLITEKELKKQRQREAYLSLYYS